MFRHIVNLTRQAPLVTPLINPCRGIARWVSPTIRTINRRKRQLGPQIPDKRSTYLEWNYEAELFAFGKRVDEEFDAELLKRALTHRSYILRENLDEPDNVDLIDAGESLISKCVHQYLVGKYHPEVANALHKHLTTEEILSHVAFHMGLADIVLCSDYPVEKSTLSKTFKALVAALSKSASAERTQKFVNDFLICQLNGVDEYAIWNPTNPYDYLQKLCDERGIEELEPRLCNLSAANTILANYQVGLYANKRLLGVGWGESVEIAKEMAAVDAIKRFHENKLN